eukprot:4092179-Amphidinium_carterae.1
MSLASLLALFDSNHVLPQYKEIKRNWQGVWLPLRRLTNRQTETADCPNNCRQVSHGVWPLLAKQERRPIGTCAALLPAAKLQHLRRSCHSGRARAPSSFVPTDPPPALLILLRQASLHNIAHIIKTKRNKALSSLLINPSAWEGKETASYNGHLTFLLSVFKEQRDCWCWPWKQQVRKAPKEVVESLTINVEAWHTRFKESELATYTLRMQ